MLDGEAISEEAPRFGLTQSQWDAIGKIRPPEEMPVVTTEARRPTSIYLRDDRFAAEMEQLFKRVPVPVIMSSRLPEPGSAVSHDGYGMPLLITRDRQGEVRAFINGCRHRGAKLIESCEAVKANRLSCPYHAWTYGLDGTLIGIARPEVFPSLKKEDLPLIPLSAFEAGGFIWVGLDPKHKPEKLNGTEALCADLDARGFKRNHIYGHKTFDLAANWKLVSEAFLEGYHAPRLHAKSVGSNFEDVASIIDYFGPHTRQLSGRTNFDPGILAGPANIWRYITISYFIFPNTVIVTSPYYTSYMMIMPRTRSRTVVDYYMMVDAPADNPKGEDLYKRSYDLILEVFGNEDFHVSVTEQEVISTGAIPELYYGGLEPLIGPWHNNIESFLDKDVI